MKTFINGFAGVLAGFSVIGLVYLSITEKERLSKKTEILIDHHVHQNESLSRIEEKLGLKGRYPWGENQE